MGIMTAMKRSFLKKLMFNDREESLSKPGQPLTLVPRFRDEGGSPLTLQTEFDSLSDGIQTGSQPGRRQGNRRGSRERKRHFLTSRIENSARIGSPEMVLRFVTEPFGPIPSQSKTVPSTSFRDRFLGYFSAPG